MRHLERSGRRALTTEVLTYPVEALSSFSRPFYLRGLQQFDCLVVTLALFVEVRASQHGEQVVRLRERQGVHHGATNKHCYARHYFRISAGMSPCLISMSLVAMARATSTTTMPTSRGVKSSFGGLPPIAILPSRAYLAARPETTALWYTSILPVGSRGCHGLIPYNGDRGKPSIGTVYPGLWARCLPLPTRDWRASACFRPQRHMPDKPL